MPFKKKVLSLTLTSTVTSLIFFFELYNLLNAIETIIVKETNWDKDDFSGETAIEALQQMDIVCKKYREHNFILTADIERD